MIHSWHRLFLPCACVLLSAVLMRADEHFQVLTQTRSHPELGKVTNWVIATERNRFSFVPPSGWSIQVSPEEKKVILLPPDRNGDIAIRIIETNTAATSNPDVRQLRERVIRKHPQLKIVGESDCYTASGRATALDFLMEFNEGHAISVLRVVFLNCPTAELEFAVTAPPARGRNQRALSSLLTNFRVEPAPVAASATQAKDLARPSSLPAQLTQTHSPSGSN